MLVGASGSGKTTLARRFFTATEIVSSDATRALVADDENALDANRDAFRLLYAITASRLRRGRTSVIDATNLQPGPRRSWLTLAHEHGVPVTAIVLDLPQAELHARAAERTDRHLPSEVIDEHHAQLQVSLPGLSDEGFAAVHVLGSADEVAAFEVEREIAIVPPSGFVAEMARRWARTWETCWPMKDVDTIAALYATGVTYRALAFRDADLGLDAVRGYLRRVFEVEAEITCRFGEPTVDGVRAAVEWWASWKEDGRDVTLAGVSVLRFDNAGLVAEQRDYWNELDERRPPYAEWLAT